MRKYIRSSDRLQAKWLQDMTKSSFINMWPQPHGWVGRVWCGFLLVWQNYDGNSTLFIFLCGLHRDLQYVRKVCILYTVYKPSAYHCSTIAMCSNHWPHASRLLAMAVQTAQTVLSLRFFRWTSTISFRSLHAQGCRSDVARLVSRRAA